MFNFDYKKFDAVYSRVKWEFLQASKDAEVKAPNPGIKNPNDFYIFEVKTFFPGIEEPGWVEKKVQEEPVLVPRLEPYLVSFLYDFQKNYPELFLATWKKVAKAMKQTFSETTSFEEDLEGWVYQPRLINSSEKDWIDLEGPIEAIQVLVSQLCQHPQGWDLVVKHFPEDHRWAKTAFKKQAVSKCNQILDRWLKLHPKFGEYSLHNPNDPLFVGLSVFGGQLPEKVSVSIPGDPEELEKFLQEEVFNSIKKSVDGTLSYYAEKARKKAEAEKICKEYEQYLRQKMAKAIAFVENLGGTVIYSSGYLIVKSQGRTWDFREFLRKNQYKGVLPKVDPMPTTY